MNIGVETDSYPPHDYYIGDLRVEQVTDQGMRGHHYYAVDIQQTFNDLIVFDRGFVVALDPEIGVNSAYGDYLPNINISTTPRLSKEDVIILAQEDTLKNQMKVHDKSGGLHQIPVEKQKRPFEEKPEPLLGIHLTDKNEPILAYRFNLKALGGLVITKYCIDANTGTIIYAGDAAMNASGSGQVFWPNPVNTLKNTSLRDTFLGTADSKFAVPLAAYIIKALSGIKLTGITYSLSGPMFR
jgi:hypothetical protein